jgi:hypothetical protein
MGATHAIFSEYFIHILNCFFHPNCILEFLIIIFQNNSCNVTKELMVKVFLEKLIITQTVKKFAAHYSIRRFITVIFQKMFIHDCVYKS